VTARRADRHLSWERFESLIIAGPPAVERLAGEPQVEIFTDPGGSRIGVRIFSGETVPDAPLAEIDIRTTVVDGEKATEISTTSFRLYREFYAFACAVADGVQIASLPSARAVDSALESWAALLERLAILSPERQTGLLGELWMLKRLAGAQAWKLALQSWQGPDAEEHDFSLAGADIEVKTTVSERRVHMIGSLTQLLAKPGRRLYILSMQLTQSGSGPGRTLPEAVADIRAAVSANSAALEPELDARLQLAGWRQEHAPYYRRKWSLRNPARLIAVDETCPSIVPAALASLGPSRLSRIVQLSYRIDLEGLGSEDGSPKFLQILP
jgi:Putative  PD-(D/E)XK family member, (DUF4420)